MKNVPEQPGGVPYPPHVWIRYRNWTDGTCSDKVGVVVRGLFLFFSHVLAITRMSIQSFEKDMRVSVVDALIVVRWAPSRIVRPVT